jgi:hypothetical protein
LTALERITERVTKLGHPGDPNTPRPLVTIEEFFEGNREVGSIGCNLLPTPSPDDFYKVFRSIASRGDVADIRVQITEFDTPEWTFSDTVYIMTTASDDEVMNWFPDAMRPDETSRGFVEQAFEPYNVPAGFHPIACWWD